MEFRPEAEPVQAHLGAVFKTPARSLRVVAYEPQLRPVLLSLNNRRLPLPRQVLEAVSVEQRLVELAPLKLAQL